MRLCLASFTAEPVVSFLYGCCAVKRCLIISFQLTGPIKLSSQFRNLLATVKQEDALQQRGVITGRLATAESQ